MTISDNISVIIPTKDRPNELKRFLQSLDAQSLQPDELIIVDGSKNENTFSLISEKKITSKYYIKYIKSEPGLTKQRNIGINESQGKYIFFFDDDVILNSKFIQVIYETFNHFEHFNIGGVMGRITNVTINNCLKHKFDKIFKKLFFLTELGTGKIKLSGFPSVRNDENLSVVNILSGGITAYKRDVFVDFCFDENLTGYSYLEDIDFSYRVSQKFRLLYQPLARCEHFATTFKEADARSLRKMLARNHFYLFKKNIPKDLFHLYAFGMSLIGLLIYNALLLKDIKACIGIIEGLMNPLRKIK
jgi:glycosyltransferase involved in cell wall biosynthesis